MLPINATLKDYFQEELSSLRSEGMAFARQYPHLAGELGLNARAAGDPQVELLMQSFAFLAGRLRHQIEQDKADLPNALLAFLYPHLEAPVPSMLVADITVKPDGNKEQVLKRGAYVSALAIGASGRKVNCRFRTCCATPLLPLTVERIEVEPGSAYEAKGKGGSAQSIVRVRVRSHPGLPLVQGLRRLRFYIDSSEPGAWTLYEMLALRLTGVVLQTAPAEDVAAASTALPAGCLRWLGEREDEAALPSNLHTHPALRLLQEYFCFPQKFLFFEVSGLEQHDFSAAGNYADLLFLFDAPFDTAQTFSTQVLRLNCVPLVNLYAQRIDPIMLDHTQYEYHVMGDMENHRYCEIYSIEKLESITPSGSPRPIAPYFAMDDVQKLNEQDYFYVARRRQSHGEHIAGTELRLSFLDARFDLTQLRDEVVGGVALCTNRRLPEQLISGSPLQLEGPGPVASMRVLSKPTPHQTPPQIGERPWKLVSQLALNHLSLADDPGALNALKDILRMHVGANMAAGHMQIDAITHMHCRTITRQVRKQDGWRGFVRGTGLTLDMDRGKFRDGHASPVLFCAILRHFFCLYATVNTLVEVNLETQDIKGPQNRWPSQAGAKPVI